VSARIRPQAQQDILDLAERLGEVYPSVGAAFLGRVEETIDFLARFPGVGMEAPVPNIVDPAIRFFTVRRFQSYLIAFLPRTDGVDVVRVIDGRRDLGEIDFGA
jgi:plasmid stabilization system protein ParE